MFVTACLGISVRPVIIKADEQAPTFGSAGSATSSANRVSGRHADCSIVVSAEREYTG